MLKRFFKKEKTKVYLGSILVAPRSDIKRHFDQWGVLGHEDLDSSLQIFLEEMFNLPFARDVVNPTDSDLGLDIVIPSFQSGEFGNIPMGDIGLPIAWRPKIEVGSRLFNLKNHKTIHTTSVLVKMPWREYFPRLLTWRAFFRFKPIFDSSDMNRLLAKACMELIVKLRKVTN